MSFGLPTYAAPQTVSRSLARAMHTMAALLIAGAILMALAFQAEWPSLILLPAMLALLPMATVLYLLGRSRTTFLSVAYLIVGGASVYWYTLTFSSQLDLSDIVDVHTTALPKVALVLVGGSGFGALAGLRWCTAGYLVAEAASSIAILQSGDAVSIDTATAAAFLATLLVIALAWMGRRRGDRVEPRLYRAARDEVASALRYRIELRAAALLHDTVLNHLAAIAVTTSASLPRTLKNQIESDLALLVGGEWLNEPQASQAAAGEAAWRTSKMYQAIGEVAAMGLEVDSTGDLSAVARLDPESAALLGLAVKQCLVNVLEHSGATDAEVAIHGSDEELLVMIIDTGQGFTEEEVGSDRLGLKNSVRGRIESVGGTVQVWSTPGRGTSIVIRLPVAGAPATHSGRTPVAGEAS